MLKTIETYLALRRATGFAISPRMAVRLEASHGRRLLKAHRSGTTGRSAFFPSRPRERCGHAIGQPSLSVYIFYRYLIFYESQASTSGLATIIG